MKTKVIFFLTCILFIATLLRFYNLATLPPALEWDEVATGYDAYSILKTGKDQFGNFLPITIRSLDDYKPPLYTYLTVGSIAIWGWNDFAVRFPAALLGVLAVFTTFGMVRALFKNNRLALLAALLLAISPWHVNFSRLALETNSTIFFTTAAFWAFLKGLQNGKWLVLSTLLFGLDLYLYHNARVFVPLFGIALLVLYYRELWVQKKWLIIAAAIFTVFCIRLIPIVTSIEGTMRFQGTSLFSSGGEIYNAEKDYQQRKVIDDAAGLHFYAGLFDNRYVMYSLRLFRNYLSHFDPNFWLFTSDYPRHHMPEMGIIYFIELPLILLGTFFLLKKYTRRAVLVLLLWILIAPIPSAVTIDVPHALRVEIMLPIFQILVGIALLEIYHLLKRKRIQQMVFMAVLLVGYFLNISFFLNKFFYHFARETSQYWQYGRKEMVQFVDAIKGNYGRVIVSTEIEQPHVFFLYYLHYDPRVYLQEGGTVSGGWGEQRNHFDKYEFKSIRFNYRNLEDGNTLFVGLPVEFPPDAIPIKKFYYLDGTDAIWVMRDSKKKVT
ncbi:phospholipid carrier-dependent glycosyltransferase [Candidatus Microgenomates bacterium]|nr:MAG: phospholipid carrier-dependent glycosyltransferase [Candidatus Microgenomates bacterium]